MKIKYTNKQKLPEALAKACEWDEYDSGDSDYTPSSLDTPVYMKKLQDSQTGTVEKDVSDMTYALYGKIVHKIIEIAGNDLKDYVQEERVYKTVGGFKIGMMFDSLYLKDGVLDDYKFTTAYKFKKGEPIDPDWEFQLNVGAYILRTEYGVDVKKIRIVGILRDHSKFAHLRDSKYPKTSIQVRELKLWSDEFIHDEILDKVDCHEMAKLFPINDISGCSPIERWETPTKYALMKKGQKKAVKLFESSAEAYHYYNGRDLLARDDTDYTELKPGYYEETRKGERKRCDNYCSVSSICPDYKEYLKNEK